MPILSFYSATRVIDMENICVNDDIVLQSESNPPSEIMDSLTPAFSLADVLIDVLDLPRKLFLIFLVAAWLFAILEFFSWWCRAEHVVGPLRFVFNTLLVTWSIVVPSYFLFFALRMKRVNPNVPLPTHWRVAVITTRAPSEPFEVVKHTLEAMLSQRYPHDTWLADEDPTEEVYEWCRAHGVRVSTRKNIEAYHRDCWPRRTKCKEGNLAYFYDQIGYLHYDIVVQLDADHIPESGYLDAMLRPFVLESVGYVSAPSICDKNAKLSWAARGRLYSEAVMHGPLQCGYTNGFAPLCIGSHYAVRTSALREIGGLGPELAEDHTTTLMMNSHGWRGVHALDAIAHGDGPPTIADCLTQEFQWSRSLMIVLLSLLPRYWKGLSCGKRIQFLFSELWYPVFALSMLMGILLPLLAIIWNQPWVNVKYIDFLLHTLPLLCLSVAIPAFMKHAAILRPATAPLFSWEAALFQILRWPWVVYGSLMGVRMAIYPSTVEFRVTPKGALRQRSLSWKVLAPCIAVLAVTFTPTLLVYDAGAAKGYYFFLIIIQIIYVAALAGMVLVHRHEVSKASNSHRL